MAKAVKKKNRRMKKTLRKTLGTLFLISAIIVAAIPVENLRAYTDDTTIDVGVDSTNNQIPDVDKDEVIYTTGDGMFQFAYVRANPNTTNKVAVILGYGGGYLEGNRLTIPETVDAYRKYSDNQGTTSGYAAVSQSDEFLYYLTMVDKRDEKGNYVYAMQDTFNADGTPVYEVDENGEILLDETGEAVIKQTSQRVKEQAYQPCYYSEYDEWSSLELDEFYIQSTTVTGGPVVGPDGKIQYESTTQGIHQRIQDAEVWYIGNQYLIEGTGVNSGTWTVGDDITDSSRGVFSGQGNIGSLQIWMYRSAEYYT